MTQIQRQSQRPTQRAPDGWESPRFQAGFWLKADSAKMAFSRPAHPRVTQTVRWLIKNIMITSENKISLQIKLGYRDFLDAYRLHRAVATKEKVHIHTIFGILFLFAGGPSLALLLVHPSQNAIDMPLAIATVAIGVFSISDLSIIVLSWIRAKLYRKQYPEPYQLTFDKNGVRFSDGTANAMYEWNFYQEAFEGKTVFILTYGKGLYSTIPKSAFQNDNEIEMFRCTLKENLTSFRQEWRI